MPPPPQFSRGHRLSPSNGAERPEDDDPDVLPPATATLERPKECINKHPTPAFSLLCAVMDRLRSEDMSKKRDTLSRFFMIWREKVGNDLYPLIRLLLPERDRERPVYNLKEAMLAKCYIEVLGLDKHSAAAQKLIKWKQPVDGQSEGFSGDFARVCYHEIAARSTVEEGTLSIEAVNALLDQLAGGRLRQAQYVPILRKVHQQCTAVEQEWIIRIILKDLRISIREKGVFSCFHPDAADLFNVCSDLKRVCWTLYKPEIRLEKHQTNIELFRSFLPQLCYRSPSSSHDIIAKLVGGSSGEFYMEEKLDGERIQLHMRGSGAQWFYCSRKAKDYTNLYGPHLGEGSLTQHIAGAFRDGVRNIILDGEMLVWDPQLEKYLAFGHLKSFATDKLSDETAPRPCFKVFDILYLNDKCLTGKRLSERKRLLHSGRIFQNLEDYKGRLEFATEEIGKSGKDIRAMLERILEARGEGLVVKKTDSVYQTNSRGQDWVKVKPEYADQMGESLDVLVLGGWWGKGGRTGKLSSLLCGLRIPQEDDDSGEMPEFASFCKVGSGMSYEDYEWILTKHKDHWKPFKRDKPPRWMKLGEVGLDDKPDVYIEPEHSFVVAVKAAEIVPATGNYGVPYTMRFPRCKWIFYDKASRDHPLEDEALDRDMWNCFSVDEFNAMILKPKKKYEDDGLGSNRRKKRKTTTKKRVQLMSSQQGQKLDGREVDSGIFRNQVFYIVKGDHKHTKAELETLVHKYGGDFTQAQLSDQSAIVISPDEKSPLVRAQKKKGISIVKPDYIYESIKRGQALPLIKQFFVFATEESQHSKHYDKLLADLETLSMSPSPGPDHANEGAEIGSDSNSAEREEDDEGEDEARARPEKTGKQLEMEDEWGLRSSQKEHTPSTVESEPQEEEEYDSDADSVRQDRFHRSESHETDEEDDDDDNDGQRYRTFPVRLAQKGSVQEGMGEADIDAYDEDSIFRHLVFYMDTHDNALTNGLEASEPPEGVTEQLERARQLLETHGGKITTDLGDPKLTHVIMDDADSGRYVAISRKTAEPKRRHIVTPNWVTECVDEETLLDEDGYKPR